LKKENVMKSRNIPKSQHKKRRDSDLAEKRDEKRAERREEQHQLHVNKRKARRTGHAQFTPKAE
jgi:hypothetical protein